MRVLRPCVTEAERSGACSRVYADWMRRLRKSSRPVLVSARVLKTETSGVPASLLWPPLWLLHRDAPYTGTARLRSAAGRRP